MTAPRIEPEWAMATIAFVDIRGFTTFADGCTAYEALAYLTEFYELAVPVLSKHGGQETKLLGDGLMTVFGAPVSDHDHATHALDAAVDLIGAIHAEIGDRCKIGVGLNSGLVLVGTIGAHHVLEVGVVGDPVNVASRVQDATRDLSEPVLVTESTRLLLDESAPGLVSRGTISAKGKAAPVAVYGLTDEFRNGFRTLTS
ncbi:MAG: adenylate cyclase [Solirubrobacteraceae bacterium]|jgi:class 3 adenylate cyclase|nr:adenylate cyclase [Solirubrobacteraceae bacterium]